jgi:hypothetical protein
MKPTCLKQSHEKMRLTFVVAMLAMVVSASA